MSKMEDNPWPFTGRPWALTPEMEISGPSCKVLLDCGYEGYCIPNFFDTILVSHARDMLDTLEAIRAQPWNARALADESLDKLRGLIG